MISHLIFLNTWKAKNSKIFFSFSYKSSSVIESNVKKVPSDETA